MEPEKPVKDTNRYKKVRKNKGTDENKEPGNVGKVEETATTKDSAVVDGKQGGQDKKAKKVSDKFAGNEKTEMLNTLVNNLYDIQKVRIAVENRNRALLDKNKELIFNDHASRMKKLEKDTVKEIGLEISKFKISGWMLGQRGIGPSLAGQTIAIIRDVGRFSNVSKLWAYSGMATMEVCMKCGRKVLRTPKREEWIVRVAKRLEDQNAKKKVRDAEEAELIGLDAVVRDEEEEQETNFTIKAKKMLCPCDNPKTKTVAQRRIKGSIIDYNPKMKKLCRNMALSLIQYNEFYGNLYNQYLQEYMARDNLLVNINTAKYKEAVLEKIRTGKATKMARRKMVKIFLSHLWVTWRKMEGLPVTKPYVFSVLGHSDYIEPPLATEHTEESDDMYFGDEEIGQ
jgi:hypothetical protein